jgi:hypothetical protein
MKKILVLSILLFNIMPVFADCISEFQTRANKCDSDFNALMNVLDAGDTAQTMQDIESSMIDPTTDPFGYAKGVAGGMAASIESAAAGNAAGNLYQTCLDNGAAANCHCLKAEGIDC